MPATMISSASDLAGHVGRAAADLLVQPEVRDGDGYKRVAGGDDGQDRCDQRTLLCDQRALLVGVLVEQEADRADDLPWPGTRRRRRLRR